MLQCILIETTCLSLPSVHLSQCAFTSAILYPDIVQTIHVLKKIPRIAPSSYQHDLSQKQTGKKWITDLLLVRKNECVSMTTYLMVGMLCDGPVLSSSTLCERYWLRSPLSMYSVTIHRGSLLTHTPSSWMIFGSFRRDKIFTSFRKSFLRKKSLKRKKICGCPIGRWGQYGWMGEWEAGYLAFFEASGRRILTATNRGRPFLTLKGNSKSGRSWGFSISHKWT